MKELTIEQKAKAYDEVREKIALRFGSNVAEEIFSEFEMNENDRVRKELVAFLEELSKLGKDTNFDRWKTSDCANWIAWLQKQGTVDENEVVIRVLNEVANSIMRWLDSNCAEGNMCLSGMECEDIEDAVRNAYWQKIYGYMKKKLEKQGEQKVSYTTTVETGDGGINALVTRDIEIPYGAKDSELQEATYFIPKGYYAKIEGDKVVIKKGEEKPVNYTDEDIVGAVKDASILDMVEPKFHEGEWVACEELNTAKIISIDGDRYEVEFIDGTKGFPHIDYIDINFHLWTIQDANDGDVLVDEDVNVIGIFEGIEGMCWHSKFYYSNTTKEFYGIECGGSHIKEFAKPATKEQRDILFAKMKEAGYEWDEEKKELKHDGRERL